MRKKNVGMDFWAFENGNNCLIQAKCIAQLNIEMATNANKAFQSAQKPVH